MRIIYHSIHLILCSKSFSESWSRAYLIYEYVLVALAYEYVHAATLRYPGFQSIISKKPWGEWVYLFLLGIPRFFFEFPLMVPSILEKRVSQLKNSLVKQKFTKEDTLPLFSRSLSYSFLGAILIPKAFGKLALLEQANLPL